MPAAPRLALAGLTIAIGVAAQGAVPPPARIVSIVPAATEMLFEIGAGDLVVGVGSFDRHPPEVNRITRVGGLVDPDVEGMLALRPDLVIVYATQRELRDQLARARIRTYTYRHGAGLRGVPETIRQIGALTRHQDRAEALAGRLEHRLATIAARVASRPRPRTLLVFDRQALTLRGIYASGGIGFLHDMLETAGGLNVFADVARESVQVSVETLLARAPDVIVELRIEGDLAPDEAAREEASWSRLPTLPAVRNGRVHLLAGDEFVVPGPRIAQATERIARVLHPEAFSTP